VIEMLRHFADILWLVLPGMLVTAFLGLPPGSLVIITLREMF
jgi:hypothetical protein